MAIRGDEAIDSPILQYRETDWNFTLRMAGRLGTLVIPNVSSEEPQATLGVPKRDAMDETNAESYSVGRGADKYRQKHILNDRMSFQDIMYYKMTSDNRYKLGDSVKLNGHTMSVMHKSFVYDKGDIREIYILGHEQEFAVPFHNNRHVTGLELEGKVLERQEQELQILLDIDAERKDCDKTWFSYSPVTNNGMYSMPLVDEKVMLQWQSDVDHDVLIVRPDRKNRHDMLDPGERHFLTDCENHLMMVPKKIEYTNPVGSIKWLADIGFDVSTNKNVTIHAQKDVNIKSQAQVEARSPERITVGKAGVKSSIDMIGGELHIAAVKKVKATSKANQYKDARIPQRQKSETVETTTASKISASAPRVSNGRL